MDIGRKRKGEWKRLHNEELNDLYSSPNIVQVIKWGTYGSGKGGV